MVAIVQSASSTTLVSATAIATLGAGTGAGNCPIVATGVSAGTNPTVSGVTLGGAADDFVRLVQIGDPTLSAAYTEIWADPGCAGGQTSVVVTYSAVPSTACVWVYEASGLAASSILDKSSTAYSGSTQATWDSGTTATTTQDVELWFGANTGYNTTITGPPPPWNNSTILNSGSRYFIVGYQIVSSTGTADYSGSYSPNSYETAAVVTLKGVGASSAPPAAPPPPLIRPHPYGLIRDEAQQRIDWAGAGVADLTVKFASTSGGVDTYNVTSPYNGTGTYQMRVLAPTAPNPDFAHAFLLMLPVEQNQDTGLYGDSIGIAQTLGANNGWNLTCVQPGYAPLGGNEGPWFADNPLDQTVYQETFTLLVTAWIRQHLAVTGQEQVYLTGFSRSGLGGQNLLFRHPYVYAACASWDTPYGMSDYDGTDPIRGTPVGGNPQGGYGTSANFTNKYELTAGRLAGLQATGQYGSGRIWLGNGAVNAADFSWYDALLTTAGIPHTDTFSNTTETHAWQADWVAAGLQAIIPSNAPTVFPQQYASHPLFARLLEVAAYRMDGAPAPVQSSASGSDTGTGAEGTPSIGVATSDAGSGADSGSVTAALSDTDAGSGADSATVGVSGAETGSGADAGTVAATLAGSDTGSGTDAGTIGVTGADSGSGADAGSVAVSVSGSDTGAGTETAAIGVAGTEAGTGADGGSVAASVPASDTGAGAEGATIGLAAADTGTGADSATVVLGAAGSDTGAASDAGSVTASLSGTDAGSAADLAAVGVSGADTGAGADAGSVSQGPVSGEGGSGSDSGTVTATVRDSDTGAGADSGSVPGAALPLRAGLLGGTVTSGNAYTGTASNANQYAGSAS